MKLNLAYFKQKTARAPQNINKVPFKEMFPLRLKNDVYGKTQKDTSGSCLYEISLLFTCWKEHDYVNEACKSYEQQLNKCFHQYLQNRAKEKELAKYTIPAPNAKNLTSKQISYMLHMYPTV